MARFCYLDEVVEARQDTTVVIHPRPMTGGCRRWKSAAN